MKKDLISLNRKEEICAGLKRLMKQKSIQKITIQELADECGISRYTFYYHFTDIYDCLSWMLQDGLRSRLQELGDNPNWEDALIPFLESFHENKMIYRHLQNSPRPDLLRDFLHREIQPLVRLYISGIMAANQYETEDSYLSFLTDFFTYALEGLLVCWYEKNLDCSDDLLMKYLHTVLDGHFEEILRRAAHGGFCAKTETQPPIQPAEHSDTWNHLL